MVETKYTFEFCDVYYVGFYDGKFWLAEDVMYNEQPLPILYEYDESEDGYYADKLFLLDEIVQMCREELEIKDKNLLRAVFDGIIEVSEDEQLGTDVGLASTLADSIKELQETMAKGFETFGKNPYEDAVADAILEKGKKLNARVMYEDMKERLDEFIKEEYGSLPKTIEIKTPSKRIEMQGIFHEQFESILKFVERNVPLMLVGPAGSGKNHTLEQVAEALGFNFYFTNAITQEYTLKGFIDAGGTYHETEFYKAFTKGGIFFLDEIDASIPEALIALNAAIANKYFDFPNGRVDAHEDFRVVAAANTYGKGASTEYVGRNQLDAATLDRFAQVNFSYDPSVESQLSAEPDLYDFITCLREAISTTDIRYIVSMRATINASKMLDIMEIKDIINTIILKGFDKEELPLLLQNISLNNKYTTALKQIEREGK